MTRERRSRFEIRKQEPSALARQYGEDSPSYIVWDKERGRAVPFGRYRSFEFADKRLSREKDKEMQHKEDEK